MKIIDAFFYLTVTIYILAILAFYADGFVTCSVYWCRSTIQILETKSSNNEVADYLSSHLKNSADSDIFPENCEVVRNVSSGKLGAVLARRIQNRYDKPVFVRFPDDPTVHYEYNETKNARTSFEAAGCHICHYNYILMFKAKDAIIEYLNESGIRDVTNWNATYLCQIYNEIERHANGTKFGAFFGPPILLVPGIAGSVLEARNFYETKKKEFNRHWSKAWSLPYTMDFYKGWVADMRLTFHKHNGSTTNRDGIEVAVPNFKDPDSLEPMALLPYFKSFVNHAVKQWDYTKGVNIVAAPYDFRKAPNEAGEYFDKVKILIESTRKNNNNRRVVILAHSMGNLYMKYFLQTQTQKWKDENIEMFICVNGPWGGSVLAMNAFIRGELGEGFIEDLVEPYLLGATKTFPSLVFLLPTRQFYASDKPLVITPAKNYTIDNYEEFFRDLNNTDAYEIYKITSNLIKMDEAPGVKVHCIFSTGKDTIAAYTFTEPIPGGSMDKIFADGDELVETASAMGCLSWQRKQRVYAKAFYNVQHSGILKDSAFFDYIQYAVFGTRRRYWFYS